MPIRQVSRSLSIRTVPEAPGLTKAAIFAVVQETFELDIKPEAVAGSPVRRGTNRRSIDTEVKQTPKGVEASIFTQSGYGGYLELGTRFMEAKPYLFPAFRKFANKIALRAKERLRG